MLEPEATVGAGILGRVGDLPLVLFGLRLLPVLGLLVRGERVVLDVFLVCAGPVLLGDFFLNLCVDATTVAVASVAAGRALRALQLCRDRGEGARKRVDLMFVQLSAVEQLRLLL
jgi:hypothetical protein